MVYRIKELKIDETEITLLKAICHLQPSPQLSRHAIEIVANGQTKYKKVLCEYIRSNTDGYMDASIRLCKILQILPELDVSGV